MRKLKVLIVVMGFFSVNLMAIEKEVLARIIEPKVSVESFMLDTAGISGTNAAVGVLRNAVQINNEIGGIKSMVR